MSTEPIAGATVTVRYFAGARAAAGVVEESGPAGPLASLRQALLGRHDNPRFPAVLQACTWRSDGQALGEDDSVPAGAVVDVLPPFAGG